MAKRKQHRKAQIMIFQGRVYQVTLMSKEELREHRSECGIDPNCPCDFPILPGMRTNNRVRG